MQRSHALSGLGFSIPARMKMAGGRHAWGIQSSGRFTRQRPVLRSCWFDREGRKRESHAFHLDIFIWVVSPQEQHLQALVDPRNAPSLRPPDWAASFSDAPLPVLRDPRLPDARRASCYPTGRAAKVQKRSMPGRTTIAASPALPLARWRLLTLPAHQA